MKQISAILIACFLFVGASEVSAQDIIPEATITVVKEPTPYAISATDKIVLFTTVTGMSNCTLPAMIPNKMRRLRIINRRSSGVIITNAPEGMIIQNKVPFHETLELMSDGKDWFLVSKSW
jgi:hypothetical protein